MDSPCLCSTTAGPMACQVHNAKRVTPAPGLEVNLSVYDIEPAIAELRRRLAAMLREAAEEEPPEVRERMKAVAAVFERS
jgi:hypothetical protein